MHPTLKICVAALFEMRAHFMGKQRFLIGRRVAFNSDPRVLTPSKFGGPCREVENGPGKRKIKLGGYPFKPLASGRLTQRCLKRSDSCPAPNRTPTGRNAHGNLSFLDKRVISTTSTRKGHDTSATAWVSCRSIFRQSPEGCMVPF